MDDHAAIRTGLHTILHLNLCRQLHHPHRQFVCHIWSSSSCLHLFEEVGTPADSAEVHSDVDELKKIQALLHHLVVGVPVLPCIRQLLVAQLVLDLHLCRCQRVQMVAGPIFSRSAHLLDFLHLAALPKLRHLFLVDLHEVRQGFVECPNLVLPLLAPAGLVGGTDSIQHIIEVGRDEN